MSTHLVIAMGDLHAGSTVGLCPPSGINLDDGGRMMPNRLQKWLWARYQECWETVAELQDEHKPDTTRLILNGDLTDGIHHNSPQVAPLAGQHFRTAIECLEQGPLKLCPDEVHIIRGTESHVGRSGELEEGIARSMKKQYGLPVIPDTNTGQYSSFWRRIDIDGILFDIRHHGRMGQRAHTRGPYSRWYAQDIALEHMLDMYGPNIEMLKEIIESKSVREARKIAKSILGMRAPDVAIRSHLHRYEDSGVIHRWPTRNVQLPCWQLMTAFAHRITAENISDIGAVIFIVKDGKLKEPIPLLYKADRPEVHS